MLCGADYLTGGYGLLAARGASRASASEAASPSCLIHDRPAQRLAPGPAVSLGLRRPHSRRPTARARTLGLAPLTRRTTNTLSGVHPWGQGTIVITRGVGVGFLPFRLLTRPEATLWRLL